MRTTLSLDLAPLPYARGRHLRTTRRLIDGWRHSPYRQKQREITQRPLGWARVSHALTALTTRAKAEDPES